MQIAFFSQFHAQLDVRLASLKTHLIQLDLVIGVVRVRFESFLIEAEGGVEILDGFRLLALVKIRISLWAACGQQSETDTQK